ncbi:MAG: transposase [Deltaproteobacteria bacterium]|nr:MAG: transposase [Deltaproteobacteria bacterium]
MSRPLRIQYPDAWYHVMNRGRRGDEVFIEAKDYLSFIDLLKEIVEDYNVKVSAYCLMPNHYHLLVQTPDSNISRAMRHLNGVYTQRYNRTHHCDGQLFRGRYKAILVEADSYLLELLRYIHRNPLEANLVDNLQKYNWSSHKGYLSKAKKWDWLYRSFALSLFSNDHTKSIKLYKQFVSQEVPDEINKILGRRKLPPVLGSKKFIDKVKNLFFSDKSHEEIPEAKILAPDPDRILGAVSNLYNVGMDDLVRSRRGYFNEPRNVAIYLTRRLRGDTLKVVGEVFGINKNSTVSSSVDRVKYEMTRDKGIRLRVEELIKILSNSQT